MAAHPEAEQGAALQCTVHSIGGVTARTKPQLPWLGTGGQPAAGLEPSPSAWGGPDNKAQQGSAEASTATWAAAPLIQQPTLPIAPNPEVYARAVEISVEPPPPASASEAELNAYAARQQAAATNIHVQVCSLRCIGSMLC